MAKFRDPEAAERAFERLTNLSSRNVVSALRRLLTTNGAPDLALTNLERWLVATSSPALYAEQLLAVPELGSQLLDLLGVSQPIADVLIQNPELSSLVFEPDQLDRLPDRAALFVEGTRLLASATSYAHALDRLRFLRQRWMLTVTLNDLANRWPQELVWRALSDLADALVSLTFSRAWTEFCATRLISVPCPVMVVAFGKLGGQELNYSSDIDLAYVLEDGISEQLERECARFCEAFGRAVSDRMGRGALYRVDLRLRPYGAAGAIVRSMRGFEGYYERYAEPWEVQALLRSRPIIGPLSLCERWEAMRESTCFKRHVSEVALEEIFSMRARIEESASAEDIKRASGGIRDVEFLVQALQLVHGATHPELRTRPTLNALRLLESAGLMDHAVVTALIAGYTFLRRLEHRIQLVGDQQTHELPSSQAAREALAHTLGMATWSDLERALDEHRRTIQTLYRSTLNLDPETWHSRSIVSRELGPLGPAALQWFDVLSQSDAFYEQLLENEGSLARVRRILDNAPKLVSRFKASVPLTELLLSGEIEEMDEALVLSTSPPNHPALGLPVIGNPATANPTGERQQATSAHQAIKSHQTVSAQTTSGQIGAVASSLDEQTLATAYANGVTKVAARFILTASSQAPSAPPEAELTGLAERMLVRCLESVAPGLTVIALGSFGNCECSFESDMDLLFMVEDASLYQEAETQAQKLLSAVARLRQFGSGIDVDLRLRPHGRRGLLVRTLPGLLNYAHDDLELWERFALGHARLVRGSPDLLRAVLDVAYGLPITPPRMEELLQMKLRVETERVLPQHQWRQVKLGHGGLNDLEWLVHLHEMRYRSATGAHGGGPFDQRIHRLADAQLLNALESMFLLSARKHLLEIRLRLQLLGYEGDLVPENPDRLDRLARSCEDEDGNAFLARHLPIVEGVRRLYHESLERLLK